MAVSAREVNETEQHRASFEIAHPVYSKLRSPLILGHKSHAEVTRDICQLLDPKPGRGWWISLSISLVLLIIGVVATVHTVMTGIGTWGLKPHGRLGFRYHELCLLDRYRSCGHLHFRHPISL